MPRVIPYSESALRLLQQGTIALAKVEAAGMRVDGEYLKHAMRRTEKRITRLKRSLETHEVYKVWQKTFRSRMNIGSGEQLGKVLFDVMGFPAPELTATGRYRTDEESLSRVHDPFVRDYLQVKKLDKALNTYLRGIERETQGEFIHPVFNLHIARTYRSSSDSPNFQNLPIRDKRMGKLIRSAFRARKGRVIVEIDYGGVEVRIAACYHKDPTMLRYLNDPTKDMHRDMAMECFLLPQEEITKELRYCGKNMFVFPQFYGSYWLDCASALWNAITSQDLKTASGKSVLEHLRKKGIRELGDQDRSVRDPRPGTFEAHIQKVEKRFWQKRFPVYTQWKKDWFARYQERGWFKTKTGFICQGHMRRNEVINYPVQGPAFHCLLWSLTVLVNEELERRKMKSLVIGQIHDSMVADIPVEELDDFLALAEEVMIARLKREWPWIITPLEVDVEVTPEGGRWSDKKKRKVPA